jgi:2-dehydro-3-deoxy-D-arabinonate dehydratase
MSNQCQIIGVGYTYQSSLAVRKAMTAGLANRHSSQSQNFTYFFKGLKGNLAIHGETLILRHDPLTQAMAEHWVEPELAVKLGDQHQIVAYTLANDLTAFSLELAGRTSAFDGTYLGKCWRKSGSLGPRWYRPEAMPDAGNLTIGLKIQRQGAIIYDQAYNTNRRQRPFKKIPDLIVEYRKKFGSSPPLSKRINLDGDFLPAGTIIMLGTGIMVPSRCYCRSNDIVTVYCSEIGAMLTNQLVYNKLST